MSYLLDTNILLRFTILATSEGEIVRPVIQQLQENNQTLIVTVQSRAEFWNVATRQRINNGYELKHYQADYYLGLIDNTFPLVTETDESYRQWRKLILDFRVSGVQVHDARLVAVMLAHGVDRILTFNDRDFRRYESAGIEVVHPTTLLPAG